MKLTAAMMVKNEAENLPRCLGSIRELCDEIVVVDTGSTDASVEICERFGATIKHSPWQDNFSLHRNESIEMATGDWILIIDADEEMKTKVESDKLKKHLESLKPDVHGLAFLVRDIDRKGMQMAQYMSIRLLKNNCNINYTDRVHNRLRVPGGVAGIIDLVIHHYGYDLPEEQMRAKLTRTTNLLKLRLEDNPEDVLAHFYIANQYYRWEDYDKTIWHGEKCIELCSDISVESFRGTGEYSFLGSIFHTVAWAYIRRGNTLDDLVKAVHFVFKGMAIVPESIDLHYDMAHFGSMLTSMGNKWTKDYGENYVQLHEAITKQPYRVGTLNILTFNDIIKDRVENWLNEKVA